MKNSNYLYEILESICSEKGYTIKGYSRNYIIEVSNNQKSIFLYGNSFPLNNNASQKISQDKSGLFSVLNAKGIPCVEHIIIKHPSYDMGYAISELEKFLEKYPQGIVVKDNKGSCGRNVFLVKNKKQLKNAVNSIFSKNQDIAVSPYIESECEYRIVLLDGVLCVAYEKQKPFVVGDGKNKVKTLIKNAYGNFNFELSPAELNKKLELNEKFIVGWKNNLAFKSSPKIVTDSKLKTALTNLANQVAETLNLRFCSVDIFSTPEGLKVLETNAIVSMEIFSQSSESNYKLVKQIFSESLEKCFK